MRFLPILFLLLVLSSPALANEWFPLEPGRTWTYRDAFGQEHVSRVVSVDDLAGGRFAVVTNPDAVAPVDLLTFWRDPVGSIAQVARYQEGGIGFQTRSTTISAPLVLLDATVGAGWTTQPHFTVVVDGSFTWEYDECWQSLIVGEETVEVPAGIFRAIRISTVPCPGFSGLPLETWYARGIGMVYREVPGRPLSLGLVSTSGGGVAVERGSWGSVKALYGN